jgi:hypothetical protein
MPTVLDSLREHLLGDELADRLEQCLATMAAEQKMKLATAIDSAEARVPPSSNVVSHDPDREPAGILGLILGIGLRKGRVIEYLDELPPSPGYEPLLVEAGWNRVAARGMAALAVQHGRRRAEEAKRYRPVSDAIRFLGEQTRQRRAILRCAKVLRQAWLETSIIETVFDAAGHSETEFIRLLEAACETNPRRRYTALAHRRVFSQPRPKAAESAI